MRFNYRKLLYLFFFVLNKKILICDNKFTSNFDLFSLNKLLVNSNNFKNACKFIKFSSLINLKIFNHLGKINDFDSLVSLQDYSRALFSTKNFFYDNFVKLNNIVIERFFLQNNSLSKLSNNSFCLFIGTELRVEDPLANLLLRKLSIKKKTVFFSIGSRLSSNFFIRHVGNSVKTLLNFIEYKHWLANFYLRSKDSLFLFGQSFFCSKNNVDLLNLFFNRGFGRRTNDVVFFSGFTPSNLFSVVLGVKNSVMNFSWNGVFNAFTFGFSYNSLFYEAVVNKNMIMLCFDSFFNKYNRTFGDLIIPQRSFFERKNSFFINVFYQLRKTSVSLVRDVESLFSISYKKSYDFFVYDSRILNFGKLRSLLLGTKLNSEGFFNLRLCQLDPFLFFSYEHLFNTVDYFIITKSIVDSLVLIKTVSNNFYFFLTNRNLFLNKNFYNFNANFNFINTKSFLNLSEFSLINNKVYFDPENDILSNNSVLLLKTYKRISLQMSNFN